MSNTMDVDRRSTKIPGPPLALKQLTASVSEHLNMRKQQVCSHLNPVGHLLIRSQPCRKPMLPESEKLQVQLRTDQMQNGKQP